MGKRVPEKLWEARHLMEPRVSYDTAEPRRLLLSIMKAHGTKSPCDIEGPHGTMENITTVWDPLEPRAIVTLQASMEAVPEEPCWLCQGQSCSLQGFFQLLASEDVQEEEFASLYKTCRFLLYSANSTDREITSLLLRALITLSNREDRARKMKVLLPDLMNLLRQNCTSLVMMALMVLQNMMKCLKSTEASSIAADVARILWYHFDEEESWVRESCISSFRDLVRTVVGKEKKWMKNFVHTVLAPLILRMNDEAPKVGQASRNALLAIAELLKWKEMKHVAKTWQTWKMAECLMKKDSSRAEQYLLQSLKYLKDPQECVRDSTIRFIGTIMRHVKDQSTEVPALIVRELQALEKGGCEFICCLAAQTSLILSRLREQQSPAGSRCSLWCWHR
ncbi:maestro heat-like repeat family member 5 [Passer domesticus]|uniref:maestro heat-like repeat family member 5 n=1 Tax=Passer domesticus TaxID=48849 RepID=UPI0030FEE1E4